MAEVLHFVGYTNEESREAFDAYRRQGWEVSSSQGYADVEALSAAPGSPSAVVMRLDDGCCDEAIAFAKRVWDAASGEKPALVFSVEDPELVARARAAVSHGMFVRPEEVGWVLKHLNFRS
jgi:hypothetical protein